MLSINGKKFMNLPEAVQWLLDNNALPFQSTASFAPDTEIAKTTIINPSPAEIKVGSLVLFVDGKVGTVSAITSNGFKVGQDATDLADGVPHITGIQLDASNHLIITMSEGEPIDAGLIKEVSSMTIDASQHLIVNYNDGTTDDLGAIFQGNVGISGNLTANGFLAPYTVADQLDVDISAGGTQHDLSNLTQANCPVTLTYAHARISNGKLSIVIAGYLEPTEAISQSINSATSLFETAEFTLSQNISTKIYNEAGSNTSSGFISWKRELMTYIEGWGAPAASSQSNGLSAAVYRGSGYKYKIHLYVLDALTLAYNSGFKYDFRFEFNYNL